MPLMFISVRNRNPTGDLCDQASANREDVVARNKGEPFLVRDPRDLVLLLGCYRI
jgi:hypothetical protein